MIVGITGAICSGKQALAFYLAQTHGFEAINVMEIFKIRLVKQRADRRKKRDASLTAAKKPCTKKDAQGVNRAAVPSSDA